MLSSFDLEVFFRLASQQSVVGLVAAGLEHIPDVKVPKEMAMCCMSTAFYADIDMASI